MTTGKRPGGLTALAVINFVFGGLNGLGVLGSMVVLTVFFVASEQLEDEQLRQVKKEKFDKAGLTMGLFIFSIVLNAVTAVLLVVSGIGYLLQRRFVGRGLGNLYAVLAIIAVVVTIAMIPESAPGGGFNLMTMVSLIYPVLTLFLLNLTFRDDFIN